MPTAIRKLMMLTLLTLIAFSLGACALIQERNTTVKLTVQYSTMKVIEQSGQVTAADVIRNVERARALVESDASVTLSGLQEQVRDNIRWDRLDAADRLLLNALLTEAEHQLAERIGSGALSADDRVTISTLLDWIEQAARMTEGSRRADAMRLMWLYEYAILRLDERAMARS